MPGARLLLVDDDEVLCELLLRNLAVRGHEVHVAANARAALAHLRTTSFDLIVLDICLPDSTGWDVLRTAQREERLAAMQASGHAGQLPVVVLSAVRASPSRMAEFHPLAYLPKPFPLGSLLRLAGEAAQRHRACAARGEEDTELVPSTLPHEEEMYA